MSDLLLSDDELQKLTGYKAATKRLTNLHSRGFTRAYIDRNGKVVLERSHYEAVTRGELQPIRKSANLSFLKAA